MKLAFRNLAADYPFHFYSNNILDIKNHLFHFYHTHAITLGVYNSLFKVMTVEKALGTSGILTILPFKHFFLRKVKIFKRLADYIIQTYMFECKLLHCFPLQDLTCNL